MIPRENRFMICRNSSAFQKYLKHNISSSIPVRSQLNVQNIQNCFNHCNLIGWPDFECDLIGWCESYHALFVYERSPDGAGNGSHVFQNPRPHLSEIPAANQMAAFILYEGEFGWVIYFAGS